MNIFLQIDAYLDLLILQLAANLARTTLGATEASFLSIIHEIIPQIIERQLSILKEFKCQILFYYLVSIFLTSGMSLMANSPTRLMQFTVHFWVAQLGSHEWFIKRARFPLGPASMMKSFSTPRK